MPEPHPSRILLSAYACEPGKGSEPGVGWYWALTLARRGHEIWVITRSNNRNAIEDGLVGLDAAIRTKLHFIYYDLPLWAKWWKKGSRGVHLYYLLWQWGAYLSIRRWHADNCFELVHHVTFVGVRQPSFMGNLGIPFIFGPVAGGEHAPWRLRMGFGWRGIIVDAVRDLANWMVRFDPLMRRTFAQADRIYVTSEQTRDLIPCRYRHKTAVQLAIAMEPVSNTGGVNLPEMPLGNLRVLYVGRFLYWKGMHLGFKAFAEMLKSFPDARLTLVGEGPGKTRWQHLSSELKIDSCIDWQPWLPQSELARLYCSHNIFLFPSLHDSGGMVALEAMMNGLPVVCLKLGGPGVLVDNSCGRAIDVTDASAQVVVRRLASALIEIAGNPELARKLEKCAMTKPGEHDWNSLAERIYRPLDGITASAKGLK